MIDIKLLTLNTHSLVEENYHKKLLDFVNAISEEMPDIIALQEVNQTCEETPIPTYCMAGFHSCGEGIVIRRDNHMYNVIKLLKEKGIHYEWTWLGMKKGYDKYDEGIGILSRSKILETEVVCISEIDDYNHWKTRKIVGIRTEDAHEDWFYSVHMGWWNDAEEPFQKQWDRLASHMNKRARVWLLGDFNSPAEVSEEGYDRIENSGWYDSYVLAEEKDSGMTVGKVIDGWKERVTDTSGMRIDQIWCKPQREIHSSKVIFNGCNGPVVSDHYGILLEV